MRAEDYLSGILQSDSSVLQAIYSNYASRIKNYVLKNGGTSDDAKDIFQDALMIIYQKAQNPDFVLTCQFYTYLFAICQKITQKKLQKNGLMGVTNSDELVLIDEADFEVNFLEREKYKIFEDNFQKLGKLCRDVLQLFFEKKNMKEIAELLKLDSESAARNRKYLCQKELKMLIQSDLRYQEFSNK